jgi:transcriptional regulator with GAF, ATPase, and Fis domain/tetratricopeptide (TPR) repeat protein
MFEVEFSIDWLEELTGMKASWVLSILEDEVQNRMLVRKRPAIYAFSDPGKRQQLLDSLDEQEKDKYRRSIADILIRELPEDDSKALQIAHHFLHVFNDWKGCQWLVRAGEIYIESFRMEDAVRCFEKVLSDLSGQRGENEDWLFVKSAIAYSNVTTGRSDTIETLTLLLDARVRAKNLKQSYEILLEMHIAKHEWLSAHYDKALKRFEHAFSKVENLGDPDLITATTDFSTYFLFCQGRFRDVIETYERSLPDVERYPLGVFPILTAVTVARSYALTGQLTQGLGMLHTIYDYCLEKGDLYLASQAGSAIAIVMVSMNRLDDAYRYFKTSLRQAKQGRNFWVRLVVTFMLALVHRRKGENRQCLVYLRRFLKVSREAHVSQQLHPYLIEICWAMEAGDLPRVPDLTVEHEIEEMLAVKNVLSRGIAYRYQALLGRAKGWSNQRIIRSLNLSLEMIGESGHQIELAKTQIELARHYLSMGEVKKVKKLMRAASEILSQTNMEPLPDDLRAFMLNPNREKAVLNEILDLRTEMVAATRDKKQLLQQIVVTINRVTGAERGAILLVDDEPEGRRLQLRSSKNLTIEQVYHANFASSRQMIEDVVRTGEGRIFEIDPLDENGAAPKEIIRSGICVPLIVGEKTVGVLYHDNRLLGNVFRESDLRLLGFFAALVALDLDSSKAREEGRRGKEGDVAPFAEYGQDVHTGGVVGTSPAMKQLLAEIDRVARTDTAVLILGETGVGKNLVANVIHLRSMRNNGPFVSVQCSALTESLITSELFGHEKGAFTGATNRRIGRFEMADKGTLFLDEIGDLSLEVQARLLRVLQSKEFERVGGGKETLTSDFRLVAATNRNLEEDIKAGKFREDLYYRINVFPLYVPPVRERKEDIPLLIRHFVALYSKLNGQPIEDISKEVMERLIAHDWPGNIREMENIVQRGLILGHGRHFQLPGLSEVRLKSDQPNGFQTLEENERQHILDALGRSRWKIHGPGGAAEILSINPSTLASRIKKLGIKKPERGRMPL